jgi:hypothetical protein
MQRITIRRMMIRIALLAGLLSILVPIAKNEGRLQHNGRLLQQADALIMSLASKCPSGVNPSIWTESVNTTQTIGANLYSSDTINTEEKERFNDDLTERLRGVRRAGYHSVDLVPIYPDGERNQLRELCGTLPGSGRHTLTLHEFALLLGIILPTLWVVAWRRFTLDRLLAQVMIVCGMGYFYSSL